MLPSTNMLTQLWTMGSSVNWHRCRDSSAFPQIRGNDDGGERDPAVRALACVNISAICEDPWTKATDMASTGPLRSAVKELRSKSLFQNEGIHPLVLP